MSQQRGDFRPDEDRDMSEDNEESLEIILIPPGQNLNANDYSGIIDSQGILL